MQVFIEDMNEQTAQDLLNWKYDEPYDFYNNELTDEEMKERLDGTYYAIVDDVKELVGFFCIGESAQVPMGNQFGVYTDHSIDLGLGMNPKLVGKGNGLEFCLFILGYIEENYIGFPIRLTVATFNQRAIHLYEKLGFVMKNEYISEYVEFITMTKKA